MSLVHDALQKAEREKKRKSGETPSTPAPHPVHRVTMTETVSTQSGHVPAAAHAHAAAHAPAPSAPAVVTQKSYTGLVTALIACVAGVAIVAIVILVSRATATIKESKEALGNTGVVASEPASTGAPEPKTSQPGRTRPTRASATTQPVAIPEATTPAESAPFKVTGIMKDPEGVWCAVLNGRVVYENHYVEGATVKRIERDRVVLDVAGRETVVRLF